MHSGVKYENISGFIMGAQKSYNSIIPEISLIQRSSPKVHFRKLFS